MEEKNLLPKKKRAASGSQIEKELKEIYKNNTPADETYQPTIKPAGKKSWWPKIAVATIVLFVLTAVTWAGIMRFGGSIRYSDKIDLEINGPTAPRAGENGTWTINYINNENLPLARAALTVNLPNSVTITSSDPQLPDPATRVWSIGTLAPGEKGSITVHGLILDAIDAPIAVQAIMSYRPANFNSDFQKTANWSSRIADSIVDTQLTAPDESVPGDNESFALTIERRADVSSDAKLPDLIVRFDPDRALLIKTATPAFASTDDHSWTTAAPADKPLLFATAGAFSANASGPVDVRVLVGTKNSAGDFLLLNQATATVKVLPGDLAITVLRNGSTTDTAINLGDTLHVSVDYENKAAKPLTDATISLTIAGSPSNNGTSTINWATLNDLRNGKRSGETITWTKNEISDLGNIAPGAKGSIDLSIKTTNTVFTTDDRNYSIDLSARGTIGAIGGKASGKTVSTPVIRTDLSSDARLAAAMTMTDGAQPPKSGANTTYRIVWALTNTLHEISGIKVSATLPTGVSFAGNEKINAPAGDVRYDDASRTVTWTLNRLPTSIKNVSADFAVNLTPSANDVGKTLPVLGTSTLTATDKDTAATLSDEAAAISTADNSTNISGVVQP